MAQVVPLVTVSQETEDRRKKKGNQEAFHHTLRTELTLAGVRRQKGGPPRVA